MQLWRLGACRAGMVRFLIILLHHLCVPSISFKSLRRVTQGQEWYCSSSRWNRSDINYISGRLWLYYREAWVCTLTLPSESPVCSGQQTAVPGVTVTGGPWMSGFGSPLTPGSGTNLWSVTICSMEPKRLSAFLTAGDDLEKLMGEIKLSAPDWNTDSHHFVWRCRKPGYACAPCLAAQQYCQFEVKPSWSIPAQFCHLFLYRIMLPNGNSLL